MCSTKYNTSDWGDLIVREITDGADFWNLYDEMIDDKCHFASHRRILVEEYKKGNMYGLGVDETYSMIQRNAYDDNIFMKDTFYHLPCFIIKNDDAAVMIWTHSRARRMGFAMTLVNELDIKKAIDPLFGSFKFWKACGIEVPTDESDE